MERKNLPCEGYAIATSLLPVPVTEIIWESPRPTDLVGDTDLDPVDEPRLLFQSELFGLEVGRTLRRDDRADGRRIVDQAVAVVVDAVADLLGAGMDVGIGFVAVAGFGNPVTVGVAVDEYLVDLAVVVVVLVIADLGSARVGRRIFVIPIRDIGDVAIGLRTGQNLN